MTELQFYKLEKVLKKFKSKIVEYNDSYPQLRNRILELSNKEYELINPFIYNAKLDELTIDDNIKYIWVTDNPGLNEALQGKYAVGSSGKGAKNFMEGFGLISEYDKEVVVLNKSCLHTRVTNDLKKLKDYDKVIAETQVFMAEITLELMEIFQCPLWILGISSLDKIFLQYSKELLKKVDLGNTYLYYHFSQGQFKKAYNKMLKEHTEMSPKQLCEIIGSENRIRLEKIKESS